MPCFQEPDSRRDKHSKPGRIPLTLFSPRWLEACRYQRHNRYRTSIRQERRSSVATSTPSKMSSPICSFQSSLTLPKKWKKRLDSVSDSRHCLVKPLHQQDVLHIPRVPNGNNMLEAIVSVLGLMFIGVFGWTIQLGNRVTTIEAQHLGLKELITEKFAEVNRRLERIERGMNGHLKEN